MGKCIRVLYETIRLTTMTFDRFLLLCLLLLILPNIAADWVMFHGPGGQNRCTETGLIQTITADGPKLLWELTGIGKGQSGFSSVTIADGLLFTAGSVDKQSFVYCYELQENKPPAKRWEYNNGGVWSTSYPGTRSTPTVDGNRVYDLSSLGELVCLDVKTGNKIWGRNIFTDFEGENITWAIAESVLIDGKKLICSPGGKKGSVVALDKMSGELIWTVPTTGNSTSYACATVFEQSGLRILAMMYARGLLLIDIETGQLLCSYLHTQRYGINCTRPIYHNGQLFITNPKTPPDNTGAALLNVFVNNKTVSVEKVWQTPEFDNLQDGVILIDGVLYGTSHDYKSGCFMGVDWKSGKILYEDRTTSRGAFTWADGLLYFLNEKGEFFRIKPNPAKLDIVDRWTLPDKGNGPYWAHPVIHTKKLYLRHGEFLYCYDIAGK